MPLYTILQHLLNVLVQIAKKRDSNKTFSCTFAATVLHRDHVPYIELTKIIKYIFEGIMTQFRLVTMKIEKVRSFETLVTAYQIMPNFELEYHNVEFLRH
jgi:hypothetical protein